MVLLTTLCFELAGAMLSFIVFVQDFPPLKALAISIFHSIAAFNNSGFDILGGMQNLIPYQSNVLLNLTTCGLILFGGLGFLVILDIIKKQVFSEAVPPLEGRHYDQRSLAVNRYDTPESHGRHHLAGRFSQRVS